MTHLSDTLLEVSSTSPQAGLLVVGEVYHPGWSATVDGLPATVHRVDYALRGVAVPGGTHRVELRYTPPGDLVGRCISLLALVAALAGLAWRARQP